jgi:hypothetical protein
VVHLAKLLGPRGEGRRVRTSRVENRRLNGWANLEAANVAPGNVEGAATFYLPSVHLGAGAGPNRRSPCAG